jgi:predicted RNA methylase
MNLQPTAVSYTISERARIIYDVAISVCDFDRSSEVFTPGAIVKEQVKGISPDSTVCVPGAGIGSYIVALLEAGVKPENIVAVELNPRYGELGEGIFKRFGVNYVFADFLEWVPDMRFDYVVGNPPYGKNASLAVKFLNKAPELADNVSYVLPRTFRKPSVLNRINEHLHLVDDVDVSDETFGGTIITCRQKWRLTEEKRERIKTYTQHPDLSFVSKAESNIFVGRVGAGPAGKVLTADYDHLTEQHYFLQVTDTVRDRLLSIQDTLKQLARAATVGTPSLSKHELISTYVDTFG